MPDFLTTLAQRTLKMVPVIQPMIAPLFSPGLPVAPASLEEETWNTLDHALKQASTRPTSTLRTKPYETVSQTAHTGAANFTNNQPSNLPSAAHEEPEAVARPMATNFLSPSLTELPPHDEPAMRVTPSQREEGITDASSIAVQQFPIDENIGETLVAGQSQKERITLPAPSSGSVIRGEHVQKPLETERGRDKHPTNYVQIATDLSAREKHTSEYEDTPLVPESLRHDAERLSATTYPAQESTDRATTLHSMAGETSERKEMETGHSQSFGSPSLIGDGSMTPSFTGSVTALPEQGGGQLSPLPTSQRTKSQSFLLVDEKKVVLAASSDVQHPSLLDATMSQQRSGNSASERLLVPDNSDMPPPEQNQPIMWVDKRGTNNLLASTSHSGITGEQERSRRPAAEITEAASGASMQSTTSPAPAVHITIGRIDVRAITTHAPETRRAPGRTRSQLSLDDYLNGQSKGGR